MILSKKIGFATRLSCAGAGVRFWLNFIPRERLAKTMLLFAKTSAKSSPCKATPRTAASNL